MVKTGQALAGLIVCRDTTGALSAPTAGPSGTSYINGVVNAASVTFTGANPYKWSVTLPTLSAGDSVQIYVTATIATIATGAIVFEDIADTVWASDNYSRLGAPSGSSISADIQSSRTAIGAVPTNPLLANSAILPGTLIASQADVRINQSGTNLIPTNPLLTNDSRLPSTLIASQSDVRINVSGTNQLLTNVALIPTNPLLANSAVLPSTLIASQADVLINRSGTNLIPTNPLLTNDSRLPSTLIASQSDVLKNVSGTNQLLTNIALIPTNPLLTNDARVPSTLIASQADVLINRSGTNLIPTNPLLTNDSRIPATLIASQNDVRTNISGTNALQTAVAAIPTTPFLTGDTRLPSTKIASQADVLGGISGTNAIPASVDVLLSANHGTGTWGGASVLQIDAQLSSSHSTGSWAGSTPAQIDSLLSTNHSTGSWAGATPQQVDTQLSASHGTGTWGGGSSPSVAQIDTQLTTSHGTGSWVGYTPQQIDTELTSSHGAGVWGAGGTGGAFTLTFNLTDSVTHNNIQSALIEEYANAGMTIIVDGQTTDIFGNVVFSNLINGTYYLKVIKTGYTTASFTAVVSGDTTASGSLVAITPTPPTPSSTPSINVTSLRRGNTLSFTVTGIGSVVGYTSLWITLKTNSKDDDAASILQIKKNASGIGNGLQYLNGAVAPNPALATTIITDQVNGDLLFTIDASVAAQLNPESYICDVQTLINGIVDTPISGTIPIADDVTRAIS